MEVSPKWTKWSNWAQFLMGIILVLIVFNMASFFLLNNMRELQLPPQRVIVADAVPPLLMQPPQFSNQYASFDEQCIQHCLSAYEASPAIVHPPLSSQAPPQLLHFIFIGDLAPGSFVEFTYMDYLVIRAAYMRLQPKHIYLHLNQPPKDSPLWDMIAPMISRQLHLEPITEIYGHKVTGRAHFSDIARLQILQKYGGMYMDIDSLSLRPFPAQIWDPPSGMTMGYENAKEHHIGCGVIVARSNSPYLRRWLESYKTFNDKRWADHTVLMAGQLAQKFPKEIDVLPETHFYRPSWYPESIKLLWEDHGWSHIEMETFSQSLAPHYWGTFARNAGKIKRMTPFTILKENVGIHQILRSLLPNPYFSIVVECSADVHSVQRTLKSLSKQSFGLLEVIVVPQANRTCGITNSSLLKSIRFEAKAQVNGIWSMHLEGGEQLRWNALELALENMRIDPNRRVHHTMQGQQIHFVYNTSRGMTRVNKSYIN